MRDIQTSDVHVGDQVRVYSCTEPGLVEGVVREVYTTDLIVALGAATTVTFRPEHINRVVLLKRRESEIPVGTTGTATVEGVPGVRVIRSAMRMNPWLSAELTKGSWSHTDSDVTDFKPDAELADWEHELLLQQREEKIRAEERERIALAVEKRFRYRKIDCGVGVRVRAVTVGEVQTWLLGGAQ